MTDALEKITDPERIQRFKDAFANHERINSPCSRRIGTIPANGTIHPEYTLYVQDGKVYEVSDQVIFVFDYHDFCHARREGYFGAFVPVTEATDKPGYDLPFDAIFTEAAEGNPPSVIIWTTFEGGDTVDHVAVVDVPANDPQANRSMQIAAFVTNALNDYVKTPKGIEAWKAVHPLLPSKQERTPTVATSP